MKKLLPFIIALLVSTTLLSQIPQSFKYQAVLRDARGNIKANTATNIVIGIVPGSATGTAVYSETHNTTTDGYGLVNLEIGKGTVTVGSFSGIDWGTNTYFVKVTVDGVVMGASQLLSVPYALYAKASGGYTESDPVFAAWNKSTGISIPASQVSDFQSSVTNNPAVLLNTAKNSYPTADANKLAAITGTNTGDNAVNALYSGLVSNVTHAGDATGAGILTLATVNSSVGKFNNVTINAKGLATAGSNVAYLTTETDPSVKAVNGIVKSNGTTISAATAGADYLTPSGSAESLTDFPTLNQNTTGTAANVTGVVAIANGGTGATLATDARTNLGLGNVENTSDANKPVSTLQQTALNLKENTANKSTATVLGISDILFPTQNAVKTYVDAQITSGSPDATTSVVGKVKLAGDLTGTANLPVIAAGVIDDSNISATAAIADTKLATIATAGKVSNSATTATNANTASAIVARDVSGNFAAGTITGALTGNVTGNVSGTAANVRGIVAVANGGTGQSITLVPGGVLYGSTTTIAAVTAAGTLSQVLTSNGSGAPTWSTPTIGTVTSVTGTAPVVSSGGDTPAISIAAATSSIPGYLTVTDWGTFNGKQNALVNSAGLAGALNDETGTGLAVFATSPTLVSPVIGAATGTSLSVTGSLTSTVATGTAPLVVTSTTSVANLSIGGNAATATTATYIAGGGPGSVPYQSAANTTAMLAAGTSGQMLTSGGAAAPSWAFPVTEFSNEYSATVGQTFFDLDFTPSARCQIKMYINGIRIAKAACTLNVQRATYNSASNGSYTLVAGDRIQIDYFY